MCPPRRRLHRSPDVAGVGRGQRPCHDHVADHAQPELQVGGIANTGGDGDGGVGHRLCGGQRDGHRTDRGRHRERAVAEMNRIRRRPGGQRIGAGCGYGGETRCGGDPLHTAATTDHLGRYCIMTGPGQPQVLLVAARRGSDRVQVPQLTGGADHQKVDQSIVVHEQVVDG